MSTALPHPWQGGRRGRGETKVRSWTLPGLAWRESWHFLAAVVCPGQRRGQINLAVLPPSTLGASASSGPCTHPFRNALFPLMLISHEVGVACDLSPRRGLGYVHTSWGIMPSLLPRGGSSDSSSKNLSGKCTKWPWICVSSDLAKGGLTTARGSTATYSRRARSERVALDGRQRKI